MELDQKDDPLFTGMQSACVEITVTADLLDRGKQLIRDNGWGEEGWSVILAHGISYLTSEADRAATAPEQEHSEDLVAPYMKLDAMYSVMKYRAYCLNQDNRVLELHASGLRAENTLLKELARRLRAEIAILKERSARTSAELTPTTLPSDAKTAPQLPPTRRRELWDWPWRIKAQ